MTTDEIRRELLARASLAGSLYDYFSDGALDDVADRLRELENRIAIDQFIEERAA